MPPGYSPADFYYLLPEIIVTTGALVVLVFDLLVVRRKPPAEDQADPLGTAAMWLSLATLAAAALTLPSPGTNLTIARGLLAIDNFGLFFRAIFLGSAAVTILMSARYLKVEGTRPAEYYFLVLCATLGMMFVAGGIDLITIFIGLETMAVSFYVLAGFLRRSRRSNESAVKYFVLGTF